MAMHPFVAEAESVHDAFVAELSDAALEESAHHAVHGSSIDREVELWWAFDEVVRKRGTTLPSGRGKTGCDDFLAELANAAYEVTLAQGFHGSFLEVRLGLWKALRRVFRQGRRARKFFDAFCRAPLDRVRHNESAESGRLSWNYQAATA
jgi:hypothetical protein